MSTGLDGWIGVDLDGTLAEYGQWKGADYVGAPVPLMLARVKAWLADGRDVRIFTARIAYDRSAMGAIQEWCKLHVGRELPITCTKDYGMTELWDDRCVQVIPNTGLRADGKTSE